MNDAKKEKKATPADSIRDLQANAENLIRDILNDFIQDAGVEMLGIKIILNRVSDTVLSFKIEYKL